jgi:hypothetical protein
MLVVIVIIDLVLKWSESEERCDNNQPNVKTPTNRQDEKRMPARVSRRLKIGIETNV